jgi:DNA-binding XRE family transcriptional regulator
MKRLGKLRRDVGLTQHDLAHLSGIARWRITFAETSRIRLNPAELQIIKNVLAKRAQEALAHIAAA